MPEPGSPLAWDRYAYIQNNPLRYVDPSGHMRDELGCRTEGCDLDQAAKAEGAYQEARLYYQTCSTQPGGCPNYLEVVAFTVAGLAVAGGGAAVAESVGVTVAEWAAGAGASAATAACADGDCTNELGKLHTIAKGTWESAKGLVYETGNNGNTIQHILQHMNDNIRKPIQGVFTIAQSELLPLLDRAWIDIQNMNPNVIAYESNGTGTATAYIVDMGETIGYIGGATGGYQVTNLFSLVLMGNLVISAYPVHPLYP